MSDIVERLRHAHVHSAQRIMGSNIFEEAADEITRLRRELSETEDNTLLVHLAYIRQKSGVGMKPMISELADAIAEKIADARRNALEEVEAHFRTLAEQYSGEARLHHILTANTILLMMKEKPE